MKFTLYGNKSYHHELERPMAFVLILEGRKKKDRKEEKREAGLFKNSYTEDGMEKNILWQCS